MTGVRVNTSDESQQNCSGRNIGTLTVPIEGWLTAWKTDFWVFQGSCGDPSGMYVLKDDTLVADIELCCAMTQCQELSGCQFILSRYRVLSVWLFRGIDALGSLSNRKLSQTTFTHLACSCLIVFSLKSLSANFLTAARLSLLSYGLVLSVWDFLASHSLGRKRGNS